MSEKRMSKLAEIDDPTREPKKKKSFFQRKVVRPIKKNPLISVSAVLIALSTLLLSVLLIAGSGSVYLSKFVFDDPIRFITKKSSITFTLYGHCVDDKCTKPSMVYRFDQMPTSSEIVGNNSSIPSFTKRLDVGGAINGAGQAASGAASGAGQAASDAGQAVSGAAEDGANKAGQVATDAANAAADAAQKAMKLLSSLLDGLKNFQPKKAINGITGLFSVPYLFALICNVITLVLLFFNLPSIAALFLFVAVFMNVLALVFDLLLFVWVFELVGLIPGIGDSFTGPGIRLAECSAAFLTLATLLLGGRLYYMLCCGGGCKQGMKFLKKHAKKGVKKLRKEKEKTPEEQHWDRV
ncbi:8628_t:CDS:2 [Paraglomus brasilianum]|uniref:8628_t:CDS:1 n=1 Tax=Paraglomus brasilianum TaxID=144538 RepID=A0A9N8VVX3_9GLOM|nr:8628_t:CDS:2 [Paraglomus brasilianum]